MIGVYPVRNVKGEFFLTLTSIHDPIWPRRKTIYLSRIGLQHAGAFSVILGCLGVTLTLPLILTLDDFQGDIGMWW